MAPIISSAMASAGFELDAAAARLAMDADAHLHLVVADLEGRLARCGDGAARQRHAHRARARVDAVAERFSVGRSRPSSAAAPTIFSTISVPATPRRPVE